MHYKVFVIGKDLESELGKFNEYNNIQIVHKPIGEETLHEYKLYMIDNYPDKFNKDSELLDIINYEKELFDNEQSYTYYFGWKLINIDGNWCIELEINPDAKYDWYELGGRWSNSLVCKSTRELVDTCPISQLAVGDERIEILKEIIARDKDIWIYWRNNLPKDIVEKIKDIENTFRLSHLRRIDVLNELYPSHISSDDIDRLMTYLKSTPFPRSLDVPIHLIYELVREINTNRELWYDDYFVMGKDWELPVATVLHGKWYDQPHEYIHIKEDTTGEKLKESKEFFYRLIKQADKDDFIWCVDLYY